MSVSGSGSGLRAALRAAAIGGRLFHRIHPRKPLVRDLVALFGAGTGGLAAAARDISARRFQNRLLVGLARRRGIGLLEPLVDASSLSALAPFAHGQPAVLLTWHLGPPFGLAGAFETLDLPVLALRRFAAYGRTRCVETAPTEGGMAARSAAFGRAVSRIREGGVVILAADVRDTAATAQVSCFGRGLSMARGAFALARLTGAPLLPVAARWDDDGCIRVAVGEPLPGVGRDDAFETSQAAAAARWLEAYLRASPAQVRLSSLQWLLDAAPDGGALDPELS